MNIDKDTNYRLTEMPNALIIGPAEVVVPSKDAKPLIIADPATLMEYMSRYLYARSNDKLELKEAHERALAYVGVTKLRKPEIPLLNRLIRRST